MSTANVFSEALSLPQEERMRLIDTLWESLGPEYQRRVDEAQLDEAQDRWAAYQRGEFAALDGPAVMAELKSRHGE